MAYSGNTFVLPAGEAGMTAHENRLLNSPGELLNANAVSFEDNHIRRERSARLYDGTGGLKQRPAFTGEILGDTFPAGRWSGAPVLVTYKGTGIAFHSHVGSDWDSQASVTGYTLTVTVPAGGIPLNARVIVSCQINDQYPAGTVAVADSRGNTYTRDKSSYISLPIVDGVFSANLDTALSAGDTITVTFGGFIPNPVPTNAVMSVDAFTGIDTSSAKDQEAPPAGTSATPIDGTDTYWSTPATGTLAQTSELLYGMVGLDLDDNDPTPVFSVSLGATAGYVKTNQLRSQAISDSVDVGVMTAYRITNDASKIIAMTSWTSDGTVSTSGTVSTTAGSATVTGVGTLFLTTAAPGDHIVCGGEERVVSSVSTNTSLITTVAWRHTNSGRTYKIIEGERLITATTTGSLLKDKPITTTTGDIDFYVPVGGLSLAQTNGFFVAGGREAAANNRKLFYFNGIDPVQVISGASSTGTAISAPPSDWGSIAAPRNQPLGGTIHRYRLAAYGNMSDPHRIYLSDPDNHEDFTTTPESVRVRSDVGDRIVSAVSFQGILFIFKYPEGIFWLDDTNFDTTNWVIQTKSTAVGAAPTPHAALAIDDDIIFMAPEGTFHLMSAVDTLGGVQTSDLTYRLGLSTWMRDNLNLSRLDLVQSMWDQRKKIAYFAVPSSGSDERDLLLKWDFGAVLRGGPVRFSFSQRDIYDGITMRRDLSDSVNRVHIGELNKTYTADIDTPLPEKAGAPYTSTYQTPHLDFAWVDASLRHRRKNWEFLEFVFDNTNVGSPSTITVELFVDQVSRGTMTFDATKTRDRQRLSIGDGHTLSIKVTQSTLNADFKVLAHLVSFTVGNEDQSR